jgi:hypothetical protein
MKAYRILVRICFVAVLFLLLITVFPVSFYRGLNAGVVIDVFGQTCGLETKGEVGFFCYPIEP